MHCTIKKKLIVDLPITLVYVIFPIISLLNKILFSTIINYEPIFLVMIILAPLLSNRRKISKKSFIIYIILFFLTLVKYVIPCLVSWNLISIRPLIMDFKWIVYLLGGLAWIDFVGIPSKLSIWKAGVFFCWIYMLYGVYMMLFVGEFGRIGLLSEANYDGFLILIPFCFFVDLAKKKRDIFPFIIATFLTGSRTGCILLFVLFSYLLYKKKPYIILLLLPLGGVFFYFLLFMRNTLEAESIDRYIFFYQSYLYFCNVNTLDFLYGVSPGIPLEMPIFPSFEWYIDNFETMNNIIGIYAFYFHSAYIRFAIVWGIPVFLIILTYSLFYFRKIKYVPLKLLFIAIFFQSVSLSTFTLTNVSFTLFLVFFAMLNEDRIIQNNLICNG